MAGAAIELVVHKTLRSELNNNYYITVFESGSMMVSMWHAGMLSCY